MQYRETVAVAFDVRVTSETRAGRAFRSSPCTVRCSGAATYRHMQLPACASSRARARATTDTRPLLLVCSLRLTSGGGCIRRPPLVFGPSPSRHCPNTPGNPIIRRLYRKHA